MKFISERIKIIDNKKGSYMVFLTMLFSGILIFLIAAITAAGHLAIDSTAEDFGKQWGRSILAEYDRNLKNRYGLIGYNGGNLCDLENKLNFYGDYTYGKKKYIQYNIGKCQNKGYELMNSEIFQKQIRDVTISQVKPKEIELKNQTGENKNFSKEESQGTRYITSRWIINGLPSKGKEAGIGITSLIGKLKEGVSFKNLLSEATENLYIFVFFKDYMNKRDLGNTYFENEIEYIISGKLNDEKARQSVYRNLLLIRNGLNLAYLYSSSDKRQATLLAAEAITPGPLAPLTQALILESWAFLEALNDLEILYDNKKVPIVKSDNNWALSIDNAVKEIAKSINKGGESQDIDHKEPGDNSNKKSRKYVSPSSIEGIEYSDYLRLLITTLPKKTRELRIMDLIQINMKFLYNGGFLMADYYTGIRYSLEVNGTPHEFDEKY